MNAVKSFAQNGSTRTLAEASGSGESYTLATRSTCDWFSSAVQRLQAVSNLQSNWDSYGSLSVDIHSVHYAHCLLSWLVNHVSIGKPKISATPSGRVCFCWERPDFEVEVCSNGMFLYMDGDCEGQTADTSRIAALLSKPLDA